MKFLAGLDNSNDRSLECLETWTAPRKPCILSSYFWLADTSNMQNSFRGFLCNLLHQLLAKQNPGFISSLITVDRLRQKRQIDNWGSEELEALLKDAAGRVAAKTPLCFFIDGLDECLPNDLDSTVKIIKDLTSRNDSKIKFCVSSRPEQKIENRLRALAKQSLELHELTYHDIRRYVTNEFMNCWQHGVPTTDEQKNRLIDELTWFSEGVFLWACLVAKKLRESIEVGDTFSQLQEQLKELPHDMMKLYEKMLEKSDVGKGDRRAEAASYFKFVIDHSGHVIDHAGYNSHGHYEKRRCYKSKIANFVPLYEIYHGEPNTNGVSSIYEIVRQRINFLCVGMVMIDDQDMGFFHRTARDFFHDSAAKEILDQCPLTELERYRLFVDGICRHEHSECDFDFTVFEARRMISWHGHMTESNDVEKFEYLKYVDKAMSRVYATNRGINENWVYEQAKSPSGDDDVLDFMGLSVQVGAVELVSEVLSTKRKLSGRYKNYLFLCSIATGWRHRDSKLALYKKLLELGANPNAAFYWGLQDRLKTSPWLSHLVSCVDSWVSHDEDFWMGSVTTLLDSGAHLDDRTVIFRSSYGNSLSRVDFRVLPPRSRAELLDGFVLVIEVNARFLLEKLCRDEKLRESDQIAALLSRPDVQKSQSYRRILLVHPGYSKDDISPDSGSGNMEEDLPGEPEPKEPNFGRKDSNDGSGNDWFGPFRDVDLLKFAEMNFDASEKLLDGLGPVTIVWGPQPSEETAKRKVEELLEIWQRSPKVDVREYLEEKGYYKPFEDPAIPKGPIPMYEDEE